MSIPEKCTVLVIGGGPGGSYAASVLGREGIDTVLLEADVFPRYHVGESMLPSMRHFLRFIDLDSTFDQHGFKKKVGAAFKLNPTKREGFTDFLAGGEDNYAWNVVRSEADNLMFRHAEKSGAKIYDGVTVKSIEFDDLPSSDHEDYSKQDIGRPISASYINKSKGTSGVIAFKYVIDASGRAGLLNTKYLKNRKYNQGLKNVAFWGYWKNTEVYAPSLERKGSPYFEALTDESGWAWHIPLHNGTESVGVVMAQDIATGKKKLHSSTQEFYSASLKLAPNLSALLASGKLETDVKSASDYSYTSSSYSFPYARVVGDAGCFIDPFFSSGVHLAIASGLSAATTICAVLRGDCNESTAADWHTSKVVDGYERFRLVVLSAYRQMRQQDEPVLSDFDDDNFDKAFALFRPIIQGTADISSKLTKAELLKTLDFCAHAFEPTLPEDRAAVLQKITPGSKDGLAYKSNGQEEEKTNGTHETLTAEEELVAKHIRARKMMRTEDIMHIGNFKTDVINGMAPNLQQGSLGLILAA